MSGRVMALYGMIFRAGPAVGVVLMGTLSEGHSRLSRSSTALDLAPTSQVDPNRSLASSDCNPDPDLAGERRD